ncbi:MAG: hypothetical protein HRT92_06555 [Piscirickettsiaceae bacterium]|nr:hypothetical protein [Piscirickettsiaceae bacterium]
MNKQNYIQILRQKGFGFIELFVLIGILAGVTATLMTLNQQPANIKQDRQWLQIAEQKVVSFAALEGRLPCPDTNGDGYENCGGVVKGYLPYLTLDGISTSDYQVPAGMQINLSGMDLGDTKLAYGVYVKPNSNIVKRGIKLYNIDSLAIPLMPDDANLTSATVDRYTPLMVSGKRLSNDRIEIIEIPIPYTNKKQDLSDPFDWSDLFSLDFTDLFYIDYAYRVVDVNDNDRFIEADEGDKADYIHLYNTLDFCVALDNANSHALSLSFLYSEVPSTKAVAGQTQKNIAFAIAYPGIKDADNNNLSISNAISDLFDKLNRNTATAFNASTSISNDYDDVVLTKSFAVLSQDLKCDSVINSMNLMATSFQSQFEVDEKAGAAKQSTLMGAILASVSSAILVVTGIQAGIALSAAIATLSTAASLLVGAISSCVILVGCGLIPGYLAAVILASTGVIFSGLAIAAVIAAVSSQVLATGLYIDISIRAAAATEISGTDFSAVITSMKAELVTAESEQTAAWNRWQALEPDVVNALAIATARFNASANYARGADDPDITEDPAFIALMEASHNETDSVRQKNKEYQNAAAALTSQIELCNEAPDADSCDTVTAKTSAKSAAFTAWNTQITIAEASYQTAYTSAMNFLVYTPEVTDLFTGNVIQEAFETRCGDISNCKLKNAYEFSIRNGLGDPSQPRLLTTDEINRYYPTGSLVFSSWPAVKGEVVINSNYDFILLQLEGSYRDYSDKKLAAENAEDEYNIKSDTITELQSGIAALSCIQGDDTSVPPIPSGIFDVNTGSCDTSGTSTNPDEIPFENNVENTLLRADDKGIAQ